MVVCELNYLCDLSIPCFMLRRENRRDLGPVRKLLKLTFMLKKKDIKNLYVKLMAFQSQTPSLDLVVATRLDIKGKG